MRILNSFYLAQFPEGSPFEDFFKEFRDRDEPSRRAQSLGSGFIIDAAGIVVTNNHVITSGQRYAAKNNLYRMFPFHTPNFSNYSNLTTHYVTNRGKLCRW